MVAVGRRERSSLSWSPRVPVRLVGRFTAARPVFDSAGTVATRLPTQAAMMSPLEEKPT